MFMGMVFQKSGRFFGTVFWNIYRGIDMGGGGEKALDVGMIGNLGLRYADPGLCFGACLGRIGCVNRG